MLTAVLLSALSIFTAIISRHAGRRSMTETSAHRRELERLERLFWLVADVDEAGLTSGAAPSGTRHLGEHLLTPGVVTAIHPRPGGGFDVTSRMRWDASVWFDEDGMDSHRSLNGAVPSSPSGADPDLYTFTVDKLTVEVGGIYQFPFTIDRVEGGISIVAPVVVLWIGELPFANGFDSRTFKVLSD